ncbi:unnamed protein product [Amoebophrya sp. A120]|nr:unnamed protein product [Amoebophrya sp. A120]|eukprot:GSA120T00026118001.1
MNMGRIEVGCSIFSFFCNHTPAVDAVNPINKKKLSNFFF